MSITSQFQSTLPVWGGTIFPQAQGKNTVISIHPPRVGRDVDQHPLAYPQGISIHPPRVGRDVRCLLSSPRPLHFNPPSPCGEGLPRYRYSPAQLEFQSTLPVWGGTQEGRAGQDSEGFQSTLPVWGGTAYNAEHPEVEPEFQSTLPVWGGTRGKHLCLCVVFDFNPPSPCGEGRTGRSAP